MPKNDILFIFLSFVRCCYVCLCAFYVDGIFGAFRMRPRRRSEEKERKHLEDDDDDKLMNDNNVNDNNDA